MDSLNSDACNPNNLLSQVVTTPTRQRDRYVHTYIFLAVKIPSFLPLVLLPLAGHHDYS
jgi:hypothetical protein